MTKTPALVRERLAQLLARGYEPRQDSESSCDHNVDFFAISSEEFHELYREAREQLRARTSQEDN